VGNIEAKHKCVVVYIENIPLQFHEILQTKHHVSTNTKPQIRRLNNY